MDGSKARAREIEDRYYATLLNSLTLDQLKTALFRLSRGETRGVRSRQDAIEAIESAGWIERELNEILLDIESRTPTRHSAISNYVGSIPEFSEAEIFKFLPATVDKIQFRPVYQRRNEDFVSITFEHEIEVREWKDEAEDVRRLITTKIRHPIVARFYEKLSVVAFHFPGFSQGAGQKASDRLSYEQVISSLTSAITYKFGIAFKRFPVGTAVKFLQDGDSPEIRVIRTDLDAEAGRVSLDSPLESNSVVDLLVSFLKPYFDPQVATQLRTSVVSAIEGSHSDYFVIFWCKEKVVTRVKLWDFAAELMFVWNGTESSFRSVDAIIQLLVSVASQYGSPGGKSLWDYVASAPQGKIITQSDLISRGNVTASDALAVAVRAVQAGLLEYVFKLRTSGLVIECANTWLSDPAFYRRRFNLEGGGDIDGNDPKAIEVGFRKVTPGELMA